MRPKNSPFRHLLSLSALFAINSSLNADVIYWDSTTDGTWGTVANWATSGTIGAPNPAAVPGASDIATFTTTGLTFPRVVTLDADRSVQGIATDNQSGVTVLRGSNSANHTLTIGSEGINHLRGGLTLGSTTASDRMDILLGASQTWNSSTNGNQAIQHQNDVSAANAGTKVLTLTGINTGSYIRGNISNGAGVVAITKTGSGIWEFLGTNTYTGATNIEEGILRFANASSLSAGSAITVADGATLSLKTANSAGTVGFSSEQITAALASANFNSAAANLGLDTSNGGFNHTGNLSGNFTLQKLGNNALTLSGTNTHTGQTLLSSGGIIFANDSAISTSSAIVLSSDTYLTVTADVTQDAIDAMLANATFAANSAFGYDTSGGSREFDQSLGGSYGLAKTGGNTLTLSGTTANTYTGLTHLVGGTLTLAKTAGVTAVTGDLRISGGTLLLNTANQIADSSNVTLNGGTMNFNAMNETIASLTLNNGATSSTGSGGVFNIGALTRTGTTSKFTINSGAKVTASNVTLSGDRIAIKDADGGNILIGGSNGSTVTELTITGNLTMTNQSIQVNRAASNQAGTRITLGGNYTGNGYNEIALNQATDTLAEFRLTSGDHTFTVANSGSGNTLVEGNTVISLNIAGDGNILKNGVGALSLSGNNTYTGTTTVNAGVIRVLHNNALGSTAGGSVTNGGAIRLENNVTVTGEALRIIGVSAGTTQNAGLVNQSGDNIWTGDITMDVSVNQNARISMTDGTLNIQGDIFIDSGEITNNTFGLVFTGNGGHGTISGNISGTGVSQNLIKNGSSTLTLTGNNTYTGLTRADDGILNVESIANNLGTPRAGFETINLGENTTTGTFRYIGTGEETNRGFVLRANNGGSGVIEQAGTGALVINGNISGNSSSSDKSLTLQGSTAGTGEIRGEISDTTGASKTHLIKSGTGTWTLSNAAKTYEGTTTVNGGTLNVTTSLTNSSSLDVSNGTFVIGANNVIKDNASVTLGAGAVLQVGEFSDIAGALNVTGNAELRLSGGNSTIVFADSSSNTWTGSLSITGWAGLDAGDDEIGFNASGLTSTQLGAISFINPAGFEAGTYSAKFDGTMLVPDALIPEPSSLLLILASGTCLITRRRGK